MRDSARRAGQPRQDACGFFEGDLVMHGDRVMCVLSYRSPHGSVRCVWYDEVTRRTGVFAASELQLIAYSPLRPGYRLVRADSGPDTR